VTGRSPAVFALALAACGGGARPAVREPLPSTHRDPPSHVPRPVASPAASPTVEASGAIVGIAASGGEDQARELLVALVTAIREGDAPAIVQISAPTLARAAIPQARPIGAPALAQQLVVQARLHQLRPDARFEDLVEPSSVRTEDVRAAFPGGVPPHLGAGDVIVRFALTPLGRRAMGTFATTTSTGEARGAIVVRPGEDPRIVAF
jgi:hypothetical protein